MEEPVNTTKTENRSMKALNITKDLIIVILVASVAFLGYEAFKDNRERMKSFEKSLTEMGTGISIDNQRKAKIAKATEMIQSRNHKLPREVAMNYAEWFIDESDKYTNVDFVLLIAIASQESAFNDKALSPTGAKGIMQLIPTTAMDMCEYLRMTYNDSILYDAKTNIRLGARYVNQLMTYFNNTEYVISGYNAGAGGGSRYRLYKLGSGGKEGISEENLKYVPLVLSYKTTYEKLL
jgi:soluble lytic murein transglycosylase-like protein